MPEEFVSYLERRAGEHLRVVADYDENSWEVTYLRNDLDNQGTGANRADLRGSQIGTRTKRTQR